MSDSVDEGLFEGSQGRPPHADAVGADADRVVSARGTEDGLVLRIDGGADWQSVLAELEVFLGGRKRFFAGGHVLIEWVERIPEKERCAELEDLLKSEYGLSIGSRKRLRQLGSIRGALQAKTAAHQNETEETETGASQAHDRKKSTSSLVDEIEQLASGIDAQSPSSNAHGPFSTSLSGELNEVDEAFSQSAMQQLLAEDLFSDDDANAKIVFGTVRSGQRVETPFSLIVIGDVNPGADLIAGGDIIVLGSLRGTAHASAYDDDGFDTVIVALQMRPMQLRIGSIISRGSDEDIKNTEIARIENRRIVVEAFNSRAAYWRKSN